LTKALIAAAHGHIRQVAPMCPDDLVHASLDPPESKPKRRLDRFNCSTVFTARRSYASVVLGVVILSVRLSVRLSVTRVLCD